MGMIGAQNRMPNGMMNMPGIMPAFGAGFGGMMGMTPPSNNLAYMMNNQNRLNMQNSGQGNTMPNSIPNNIPNNMMGGMPMGMPNNMMNNMPSNMPNNMANPMPNVSGGNMESGINFSSGFNGANNPMNR